MPKRAVNKSLKLMKNQCENDFLIYFIACAHSAGPRLLENGLLLCEVIVLGCVALTILGFERLFKNMLKP